MQTACLTRRPLKQRSVPAQNSQRISSFLAGLACKSGRACMLIERFVWAIMIERIKEAHSIRSGKIDQLFQELGTGPYSSLL